MWAWVTTSEMVALPGGGLSAQFLLGKAYGLGDIAAVFHPLRQCLRR
jgi:hypothetical protein